MSITFNLAPPSPTPAVPSRHTVLGKRPLLLSSCSRQIELLPFPSIPRQPNPPSTSEPPPGSAGREAAAARKDEGPRTHRTSEPTYSPAASMASPAAGQRRPRRLSGAGGTPPRGGAGRPLRPAFPPRRPRREERVHCRASAKFRACPQHQRQGGNNRCKTPHVGRNISSGALWLYLGKEQEGFCLVCIWLTTR